MKKSRRSWLWSLAIVLVAGGALAIHFSPARADLWAMLESQELGLPLEIQHPISGAILPRNMPAPVLLWKTNVPGVDRWVAGYKTGKEKWSFDGVEPMWRPNEGEWRHIKQVANGEPVQVIVVGYQTHPSR